MNSPHARPARSPGKPGPESAEPPPRGDERSHERSGRNRPKASVCPHDCPSVCALDVEVVGGSRIGRVRGAPEQTYTSGVVCAKVARYSERIHHPDRLTEPLRAGRAQGLGTIRADRLGRGARPRRGSVSRGRAAVRVRKRLALFLRRHDGPRDARRDRAPDPRQALFALLRHDLRRDRLAGLCRRHGGAGRRRPARNGEVGLRRDLGNQRGRDPGQRDDPRRPRPEGARREDRRHRHLRDRDDAAGRSGLAPSARHGRRARLRRHARPLPRRSRRPRLSRRATPTRRPNSRRICGAATQPGRRRSPASRSRRSKPSPRWSARPSGPSSASATASRASATARSTCMRRSRSRP